MNLIFEKLRGGLIVSCQALESEPLHSSFIMSRMALAAKNSGAVGIRANTVADVTEIRKIVQLPMIGIIKQVYADSNVYITPTVAEVDALVSTGVEIIAIDGTDRLRTGQKTLNEIFAVVRKKYPKQLFMADCSTFEECVHAEKIGFDCVGTTMCGYTPNTAGTPLPACDLIAKLCATVKVPIVAEGGIHYPEQLKKVFDCGAFTAVVGGAITRPQEITARFVSAIQGGTK